MAATGAKRAAPQTKRYKVTEKSNLKLADGTIVAKGEVAVFPSVSVPWLLEQGYITEHAETEVGEETGGDTEDGE